MTRAVERPAWNPKAHGGGELGGSKRIAAGDVGGMLRFKYFRRPMVPYLQSVPPDVLLARAQGPVEPEEFVAAEPAAKTVGTQSDYRESEAQTDPYTPDYTVRPGSAPELLTLVSLAWGAGLPAGLAEVEMIERARAKRAFEASLPPIDGDDPNSFIIRRKLMAEQELKEWAEREKEIEAIEGARLELIQKALQQRDEEKDRANFQRLEHARQMRVAEKDQFLSTIHKRRLRSLRKLTEKRQNMENRKQKRDIISDYINYDSQVYAPITRRGGAIADRHAAQYEARPQILSTLEGLMELEATLPRRMTTINVTKPGGATSGKPHGASGKGFGSSSRKDATLSKHLAYMDAAIQKKKDTAAGLGTVSRSMADKYAVVKPVERPPVPEISAPAEGEEEVDHAATLLQRLLRGRATQNSMFAAKEKRAELIKELRLAEVIDEISDELKVSDSAAEERTAKEQVVASSMAAVEGEMVGTTLQFLSTELVRLRQERQIQAMALLAERTRRLREAEEAGKRAKELEARQAEDERFRQVMRLRQGTVDRYLSEIMQGRVEAVAEDTAAQESLLKAEKINAVVDRLEERYNRPEVIVQDLVASYLLPEVDRQLLREEMALDQAKLSLAVRNTLLQTTNDVDAAVPVQGEEEEEAASA
eukprot:COSAG01_NODE_289_length_19391_cov_119.323122_5_plen_649_part_00